MEHNGLSDNELLDFIIRMKRKARKACNGKFTRISYTQEDRELAVKVLELVEGSGGTAADACEMLSLNKRTLHQWLDRFTEPDTDWTLRQSASRLMEAHGALLLGGNYD